MNFGLVWLTCRDTGMKWRYGRQCQALAVFGAAQLASSCPPQDAHILCAALPGKPQAALFAVFDGHGGDAVAKAA